MTANLEFVCWKKEKENEDEESNNKHGKQIEDKDKLKHK